MSFHQENRTRYLESGQRLCNETLKTIAQYFDNIFNSHVVDCLLTKKSEKQIEFCAKRELRQKMVKRYNDKIRNLVNQRYRCDDRCHKRSYTHCQNYDKKYMRCNHDSHHGHNHHYKRDNKDHKSLPERDNKAFKPCHLHGPKSQQTFERCFKNLKNQDKKSYSYDKKRAYEAHHYDECHVSKDKESCSSVDLPAPSNSHTSPSEDKQQDEDKQYHVHFKKKVKVGSQVAHLPCKKKTVSTTLKNASHIFG